MTGLSQAELDEDAASLPPMTVTEENGIKTIVEYHMNEQNQKVKVTRKIKRVVKHTHANHAVVERKKWKKFGAALSKGMDAEQSMPVLSEEIRLILKVIGGPEGSAAPAPAADVSKKPKAASIICRHCKGEHWSTKCPFKDTLGSIEELLDRAADGTSTTGSAAASTAKSSGPAKYVPPSYRAAGALPTATSGPGGDRFGDEPSIRVTNLSEDANEEDLHNLFGRFGPTSRMFLSRDKRTGRCKGFAFITYRMREDAVRAIEAVNQRPFDNLILTVEWSKKD